MFSKGEFYAMNLKKVFAKKTWLRHVLKIQLGMTMYDKVWQNMAVFNNVNYYHIILKQIEKHSF